MEVTALILALLTYTFEAAIVQTFAAIKYLMIGNFMLKNNVILRIALLATVVAFSACETTSIAERPPEVISAETTTVSVKELRPLTLEEKKMIEVGRTNKKLRQINVYYPNNQRVRIDERSLRWLMMNGHFEIIRRWDIDPFCPNC